jgi:hypothetical protein
MNVDSERPIPSDRHGDSDRLALLPLYASTRALSWVVSFAFLLAAAVSWTAAGFDLGEVRTFVHIQQGAGPEPAEQVAHERVGGMLRVLQFFSAALVAASLVPWLYQLRCNLRAFGLRRLRFGREWTILAFLVPALNLVRPWQVVNEVWRGSFAQGRSPIAWQGTTTSPLVTAWWATLIAWIAIEMVSALLLQISNGVANIQLAHGLALGGDTFAALSASFGYLLVARLQTAQELKAKHFDREGAPTATVFSGQVVA